MEKWNSQAEREYDSHGANKRLVLHMRLGYGSLSITAPVLLLGSKRIARARTLAAVNQISVIHEAMNSCKNLKIR